MTEIQQKIFDFCISFFQEHSRSPSLSEIAKHMKYKSTTSSANAVYYIVKKGYLEKDFDGKIIIPKKYR